MAVTVTVKRDRHLHPDEVGDVTCTRCGSELRAERADFQRMIDFEDRVDHPYVTCPVCGQAMLESEFEWIPFSETNHVALSTSSIITRITLYQKRLVERAESLRKFSVPNLGGDLAGHALEVQKIANELETLLSGGEIEE